MSRAPALPLAPDIAAAEASLNPAYKWRTLLLLALAELLGMAVWFSASAVVPALTAAWNLGDSGQAWLTMSVHIGFVVGAFGSAVLNLADRIPARRLFTLSAWLAALATALIPLLANGLELALPLRFLTGLFLAGVYPVGLTLITIRLIPPLEAWVGWRWAFAFLAIGPALGMWAMFTLRRSPAASRLAGGRG